METRKLINPSCQRGYLKNLLLVITIALSLQTALAQSRITAKRSAAESEPQQPVSFDTLLAVDSYKIYGEVRGVGQLIRSDGVRDLLDPIMKLAAPPREFRSLVKWLNGRADSLMTSRLLFAAWPSRPRLPQVLVAVEFASPEEAQKFGPRLKEFLPKLLPAPTPESSPAASPPQREEAKQNEKPASPPYFLKQTGSLVLITDAPFALKDLTPRGSKVLAEDQNFRVAYDRFSSEPLFLYVDLAAIEKEESEQRRKAEDERKRVEAETAKQARLEAETKTAETPAPEGPLPEATAPNAESAPGIAESMGQPAEEVKSVQPNPLDAAFFSLSSAFFGGRPRWPQGIGASLVLDGDSYVVRLLLVNSDEKGSPIPFFPQLAPGPALAPESPSVLPADTELFVAASLDSQRVYQGMLDAAKAQFEEMQKYKLQSINVAEPVSPFAAFEKKLGIKLKDDLLPLLGNEVAFTIPMKELDVGPSTPPPAPVQPVAPEVNEKLAEVQGPSLIFAIAIKDREAVKTLIPKIIDSMGLKGASMLATTEKRDDTELVSYAGLFSYAFIGNFLVGSPDPKAVHHVVDSYLKQETLSSSTHYRNYTRWQPRQVLGQAYVSPALMESYNLFAKNASAQISDQLRDFLMLLSPVPQPVTYAVTNEGLGPLHELHVPKNLVMLMVAGISGQPNESPMVANEAIARSLMQTLARAQATYQLTEGAGRYGTLEELTKAGIISKQLLENSGYKIGLIVSNTHFEISAVPTEYGKTGKLSFFLDESSVLRAGDHGGGAATIADKPIQ